jgi:DEAD/DEAH box helicase domain-containing protein
MLDPIKSFETIVENFKRYIRTAFRTRFDSFEQERESLLNEDGTLYRQPWVEPMPEYKPSGKTIDSIRKEDLGFNDEQLNFFQGLVRCGLFPAGVELHSHQYEMLQKTVLENKNCVITSGTGSGKTESFLLPLFANLSREAVKHRWKEEVLNVENRFNRWWRRSGENYRDVLDFVNGKLTKYALQRGHENRSPAIRALLLYPMNALVEDQMTRLRTALDSNAARIFFEGNDWEDTSVTKWKHNRIYFGRYNGATPIPGVIPILDGTETEDQRDAKLGKGQNIVARLREELRAMEDNSGKVIEYIRQHPDQKDKKYFFPFLDGAEMFTRLDMQETPPDIFITNFSMLSIMLMREADAPVFEKTKEWLNETNPVTQEKENVFHLIIDELHLYRGTQGTEVAFLIRMLLNRLGLQPDSPQLRILASSASLESTDPDSLRFLKDFFGVEFKADQIIQGKFDTVDDEASDLSIELFQNICSAYDSAKENILDDSFQRTLAHFSGSNCRETLPRDVVRRLSEWGIGKRFIAAFGITPRAIEAWHPVNNSETLAGKLFGTTNDPQTLKTALRGLLILRGLKDLWDTEDQELKDIKLPRLRFHYFIRNIEGLWATADLDSVKEDYRDRNGAPAMLKRTIGKLSAKSGIVDGQNRLFDALYCENCGTAFLGGNRLYSNNKLEMIAVSPDIEGIPEKGAQSLIEKRKYPEYVVFWPEGDQTAVDPEDFSYRRNGMNGTWSGYYLNKKSGSLEAHIDASEDWVYGKLFVLDANHSGAGVIENALPCTCPACGSNYEKGKSRLSPVRGFRSGFSKTAQILAKELFYQLPDSEDKRKLVLFSDSREDAAQMANGIERNHFPDLVREAIIHTLYSSPGLNDRNIATEIEELSHIGPLSADAINSLRERYPLNGQTISHLYRWKRDANDPGLSEAERREATRSFNNVLNTPVSILFEDVVNANSRSVLQTLFTIGVNPQGCDREMQKLTDVRGSKFDWWDENIFTINDQNNGIQFSNNESAVESLKTGARDQAAKVLFGKLYFGLESSGLAFIGLRPELYTAAVQRNLNIDRINSYIRVLGDNYYYEGSEYDVSAPIGNWNRRVKSYMRANNENPDDVFNTLRNLTYEDDNHVTHFLINNEGLLRLQCLSLYPPIGGNYYRCTNCFRPHLHYSNNICTFCKGSVEPALGTLQDLWEENFLAFHARVAMRTPLRLHCEEMTGQTDDQFERQRHFRNMVLRDMRPDHDEGPERVKKIDLLCVTTTLEVGVDIGSLQAVMLGNMPPQRFNYQQRVGRAGRRGQAYSVILTFCRGRSHDEHYFNNPKEITGDPPPTPMLSIDQVRIFKRVFNKFIISEAFRNAGFARNGVSSSTHGEMGRPIEWIVNQEILLLWLDTNRPHLQAYFDSISFGTGLDWKYVNHNDYYTGTAFFEDVNQKVSNANIPGEEVSDKLAEGGILPMFGMPTSVKNLYHGFNPKKLDMLTIDRDQSMAITEFAPGSEKTKDKAILRSIGLTPDLKFFGAPTFYPGKLNGNASAFLFTGYMTKCTNCNRLDAQHQCVDFDNGETLDPPMNIICENCGMPALRFPLVIPAAYRTDFEKGKDNKEGTDVFVSRPPIYAVPNLEPETTASDNYTKALSATDTTWRINNNGGDYFLLEKKTIIKNPRDRDNVSQRHELPDQWVLPGLNLRYGGVQILDTETSITTALAANKTTEVFRIQPLSFQPGFFSNMFDSHLQSSGVKAAVYSAAFLLQRAIAVDLDVDPTEIEIADIRRGENGLPVITLTDELPNGSGFVRHAYKEFSSLVNGRIFNDIRSNNDYFARMRDSSHIENCKDACYKCLKVYRNMNYHGLLDWRLGFSWLRFMMDQTYKCGADGIFGSSPELDNWPSIAKNVAESIQQAFQGGRIENHENKLYGLNCAGHPVIVVHPLWDFSDIREEWLGNAKNQLESVLRANGARRDLRTVDTFNGLRRPAKCKTW